MLIAVCKWFCRRLVLFSAAADSATQMADGFLQQISDNELFDAFVHKVLRIMDKAGHVIGFCIRSAGLMAGQGILYENIPLLPDSGVRPAQLPRDPYIRAASLLASKRFAVLQNLRMGWRKNAVCSLGGLQTAWL